MLSMLSVPSRPHATSCTWLLRTPSWAGLKPALLAKGTHALEDLAHPVPPSQVAFWKTRVTNNAWPTGPHPHQEGQEFVHLTWSRGPSWEGGTSPSSWQKTTAGKLQGPRLKGQRVACRLGHPSWPCKEHPPRKELSVGERILAAGLSAQPHAVHAAPEALHARQGLHLRRSLLHCDPQGYPGPGPGWALRPARQRHPRPRPSCATCACCASCRV
jgi:hypothetical protein